MSESRGHEYLRAHQIADDVLLLNLEQESAAIIEAARQTAAGHTAKTLVKEGPLRVVLLGLTSGSALREHSADGPVIIQVLSGAVNVEAGELHESLGPGRVVVLGPSVGHSVVARTDAAVLLTIAWPEHA
jgi:quercetin dioxygenase-like cupin family protein